VADVQPPETKVAWLSEKETAEIPGLAEDARLQAKALFGHIPQLLGGEYRPADFGGSCIGRVCRSGQDEHRDYTFRVHLT
jgi:hypothetical protein